MMSWSNPLPFALEPTSDPDSFRSMRPGWTGLPIGEHPGAFGFRRRNHVHEGVDLYAPIGTSVTAVESGTVVAIAPFTGPAAGSPWWLDTMSVMVEGDSGVVLYGEIAPGFDLRVGDHVERRKRLGELIQVLRNDKGRPMTMLHIELHVPGTREALEWTTERPPTLLDPTQHLLNCRHSALSSRPIGS